MAVGLISVTEMGAPSLANSTRSASVKALTACFDAEYADWSGMARSEATLPMLMMAMAFSIRRDAP